MGYTVKDILQIAITSEAEAQTFYLHLKNKTDQYFLKEQIAGLAEEEGRHKNAIAALMKRKGVSATVSAERMESLELPSLAFDPEKSLSELFELAKGGEDAARRFYASLAEVVEGEEERALLRYLSEMEASHYHLLDAELTAIKHFERFDDFNEMMHAGP